MQSVDALSEELDISQEPIVHRLLLQPVVCSSQKERYEKQARGKRKRRGTQTWTGESGPFSSCSRRIFFSYALFSGSACPDYSGTSPLGHLYSRDTKFGPGKMFTSSLYLLPLLKGHLYLGERDTFVGSKTQVKLPFSRVPINAHVCVGCVVYNQKSKRTQASLSARVSETHKDIFATILEIPTCFINSPFCLIGEYVPRTLFNVFQLARTKPTQISAIGQRKRNRCRSSAVFLTLKGCL